MNQNLKTVLTVGGIIVVVLIVLSVVLGSFGGWQRSDFGMMGSGMMGGFTMFLMPVFWVVITGLIIWLVVAALQGSGASDSTANKADSPMEILKRRYAQGEIDKEEYEAKKKDLS